MLSSVLASSPIQSGDLVFVHPFVDTTSPLDRAILAVGNATIEWLQSHGVHVPTNETSAHVALVLKNGSDLLLVEAVPPAVRVTPWSDFFSGWPGATFYHASLASPRLRKYGSRAAQLALSQVGVPYSDDYSPPPRAFYCSSLVDYAYSQASSDEHILVTVAAPFHLIFVPHEFWARYYASLNMSLPPANTTGTNPTLLLHSPHMDFAKLPPPSSPPLPQPSESPSSPLLSTRFVGSGAADMRELAILLGDSVLWPPGSLAFLQRGVWLTGADLVSLGSVSHSHGSDRLGVFTRMAALYRIGTASDHGSVQARGALIELSVRSYDGTKLVFAQSFPEGLNASAPAAPSSTPLPPASGLVPLSTWPSLELTNGGGAMYAWRSWHGTYGSYSGVGLTPNDTLVFNGVPTMPLLFLPPTSLKQRACLMLSPLSRFKDAAHAATKPGTTDTPYSSPSPMHSSSWWHGPSSRFAALPAGYTSETILVASAYGPTATVHDWGAAMRAWHQTDHTAALASDPVVNTLGVWTDNGAFYNFNKWAGNRMAGYEWSPRHNPSQAPDAMLTRALTTLRASGVRPGYLQLDDWYYHGVVYEGAVSCVRDWGARPDWFPHGLSAFSKVANIPLLLYMPYLCNDTSYRKTFALSTEGVAKDKHGGVPDAPSSSACAWPENKTCVGRYSLPSPNASEAFYSARFEQGRAFGMAGFEHDFVGQDSLDFGWTSQLGAGSAWIQGMGRAAARARVPMQLCLATASDMLESLTMPWVTNARASGDYAFCADSWDIGMAGLLLWAVGVRPFKDVFWTTARQPGSPYDNTTLFPSMYAKCRDAHGTHAQPNVHLDALISAFSTGPVGIGDGDGYTDAPLVLRTCRADGVLLPPSKPLSPLDRTWWPPADGTSGSVTVDLRWLLGSYSRVNASLWQYVVAIDAPCATTRAIDVRTELYWPPADVAMDTNIDGGAPSAAAAHAVLQWGARCAHDEPAYTPGSCVARIDAASPSLHACTTPGGKFPNGTHSWSLTTLAPILPGGWALLGEADKFVRVSSKRFTAIDGAQPASLHVTIEGMVGETVQLVVVTPPPSARVLVVEATLRAARGVCNVTAAQRKLLCA